MRELNYYKESVKQRYEKEGPEKLAKEFNRSKSAVIHLANRMGLKSSVHYEKFPAVS